MTAANARSIRRFRLGRLLNAFSFQGGPGPGEPFPEFDLATVPGHRIHKADYVGERPLLMLCRSTTSPIKRRTGPGLRRLYDEYGDRVAFVTLFVPEANAGDRHTQPDMYERMLRHARDYQYRERVPWTVAVDDLDGTLQRDLAVTADAAYVMALDGTVALRTARPNERQLRKALRTVAGPSLKTHPRRAGSSPVMHAVRRMRERWTQDEQRPDADVRREASTAFERLAAAFRALPAPARAAVALAAGLLPIAVAAGAIRVFAGRASPASEPAEAPDARAAGNRRHD